MSLENVEIVRRMLEPFNGIDAVAIDWRADEVRDALGSAYSDDLELRPLASGRTGLDEIYRGVDGLVEYFRTWLEPFSEYRFELLDYLDDGERVLVPMRGTGVGRASGARAEIELATAYELRDGRIRRIVQYKSLEEARQAAGLAE
jgi:ketosteroid isomerase-like protein